MVFHKCVKAMWKTLGFYNKSYFFLMPSDFSGFSPFSHSLWKTKFSTSGAKGCGKGGSRLHKRGGQSGTPVPTRRAATNIRRPKSTFCARAKRSAPYVYAYRWWYVRYTVLGVGDPSTENTPAFMRNSKCLCPTKSLYKVFCGAFFQKSDRFPLYISRLVA